MTAVVYTRDRFLSVGGTDLSGAVIGMERGTNNSQQDNTKTGASNRTYGTGLPDHQLDVELEQDRSIGSVHLTLQPLTDGTATAVVARPTSGDPYQYDGQMRLVSYTPIAGGDADNVERFTATFVPAGNITVTNS